MLSLTDLKTNFGGNPTKSFKKYNFQVRRNTKKDHLPVDSAERVHSRTAESSSFTVITNTDLLAT